MSIKILLGLALGFAIGVVCQWLSLPLPAPPVLTGALLVVAMTLGYLGADWAITRRHKHQGTTPTPATSLTHCGGPTGHPTQTQEVHAQ